MMLPTLLWDLPCQSSAAEVLNPNTVAHHWPSVEERHLAEELLIFQQCGGALYCWKISDFQQDGAPAVRPFNVGLYLNTKLLQHWIGRGGPIAWPARSRDSILLDISMWVFVRSKPFLFRYNLYFKQMK